MGPGNWKISNRNENPAGPIYGTKKGNYSQAFKNFIKAKPKDKPFAFWFGSSDPHRAFKKGSGLESGKKLNDAEVPTFLPDSPEIRNDLLDYAFEVERFDNDCGKFLDILSQEKMTDNTMIIVTSDNGMAFPYAKANCTEFGIHMPLAISWKKRSRVIKLLEIFWDSLIYLQLFMKLLAFKLRKNTPYPEKVFLN